MAERRTEGLTQEGEGVPSAALRRRVERLHLRKDRTRLGRFLIEGLRSVGEALRSSLVLEQALVSPRLSTLAHGAELAPRLRERGVVVTLVTDEELQALSATETPQGVLLVARIPEYEKGLELQWTRSLVLDGIQDPGNVGTLVRSAHLLGLDGVVALEGTVDVWSPKAVRASAGSVFHLPVVRRQTSTDWSPPQRLLGAHAEGTPVGSVGRSTPWALAIGNEGAGLGAAVQNRCSETVSIPMVGSADSLNAAVAGSILMYALTVEGTSA